LVNIQIKKMVDAKIAAAKIPHAKVANTEEVA
jgi:hypothetical protein